MVNQLSVARFILLFLLSTREKGNRKVYTGPPGIDVPTEAQVRRDSARAASLKAEAPPASVRAAVFGLPVIQGLFTCSVLADHFSDLNAGFRCLGTLTICPSLYWLYFMHVLLRQHLSPEDPKLRWHNLKGKGQKSF